MDIPRVAAIASFLIFAVPGVEAQQASVKVVGVLHPQRLEHNPAFGAFAEALRQLGYREGGNLRILVRSADGLQARLPALAAELVAARPDVILAVNTPGTFNVEIRFFPVKAADELPAAFKEMTAWRADSAIWLVGQQHALQSASIKLAAGHRIPLMVGLPSDVQAGGLVSYTSDPVEVYRRAAVYVDRILKGAKPGDLPVEQSTKFILAINRKAAHALGIAIPASLLIQADRIVE